jgi:hypothetical protein
MRTAHGHLARPSVLVPVTFSDLTTVQPAAVSAACWIDKSWSIVETRAYP